jgi:superfamily II DNA or RNA helicase
MPQGAVLQQKILRRTQSPEEYAIYRAALEWDLDDPIVIENADDLKSAPRWQERLTPFHHQVTNLITFCRRLPVTLLADDVGLGKTISAGLIVSELVARARLSKILIVCPKLLGPQWQAELLEKFDIPSEVATGRRLMDAEPEELGAVITTYNSARLYLDKIPEDRFQMLILDEAHKLRNLYGVENPPKVAKRFREALQERRFRFVLMLTATPLHNRLWDLYSLVDLLTVARGHQNPFGTEGAFARRFIADGRDKARELKSEAQDEFKSIVFGYMSRVRRGDANLYFPERKVLMHQVDPTPAELQLIKIISKPIQKLNRLAQISILQALTSSPDALSAQLNNMARRGSVPVDLARDVKTVVEEMPPSAKLRGLQSLLDNLKKANPEKWRLVVFTGRRETQTTIQIFLEKQGLKVGIINGDSGERNQETISNFRKNPPDHRIIVSTEAGSEGVNLQVANVLVNFDLPWNPMIVEQRIGRVQRLASEHAHVSIYNITLRGTFEDFIVGRLLEKLQLASHAIGDLEALLQGSEVGDDKDDDDDSFEGRILRLVLDALAGKDNKRATELELKSIENAKKELELEGEYIEQTLGNFDGAEHVGPRVPKLPAALRSMDAAEFTLSAFKALGAHVTSIPNDLYLVEENKGRHHIRFVERTMANEKSNLYAPGTPHFQRLVTRVAESGVHKVEDIDVDALKRAEEVARQWVLSFEATPISIDPEEVERRFDGTALVRVRATVAHDSYERLVDVSCAAAKHRFVNGRAALSPLEKIVEDPATFGVAVDAVIDQAKLDEGISEFVRFYLERRENEIGSAGNDERKKKKLYDEFSPQLNMAIVGLEGRVHRHLKVRARYRFGESVVYDSSLSITPHKDELADAPEIDLCLRSGRHAPRSCFERCEVTGATMLRHLLVKSELSGRFSQPEFVQTCGVSGKKLIRDEVEISSVTGNVVGRTLLKTSGISGSKAEAEHFSRCEFSGVEALNSELAVSDLSRKKYRVDEAATSAISGKVGHGKEFVDCHETRKLIALSESEQCEKSGNRVSPGILVQCQITGKRVLPSELSRCAESGKVALRENFVTSSVSQVPILGEIAVRSIDGAFCGPSEAILCWWSGQKFHPQDVMDCTLLDVPIHVQFLTEEPPRRLRPFVELLDGSANVSNGVEGRRREIEEAISKALAVGASRSVGELISPDSACAILCAEIKSYLGLRVQYAGALYSLNQNELLGQVVLGKRGRNGWERT